jgi:hypothetical protein
VEPPVQVAHRRRINQDCPGAARAAAEDVPEAGLDATDPGLLVDGRAHVLFAKEDQFGDTLERRPGRSPPTSSSTQSFLYLADGSNALGNALEAEEAAESVESRRASSPLATWRTSMNQRPSSEEMYRWRHEPAVLQCTGS